MKIYLLSGDKGFKFTFDLSDAKEAISRGDFKSYQPVDHLKLKALKGKEKKSTFSLEKRARG